MNIPKEAVDAAAKGLASANLRSRPWNELAEDAQNHFRRDAKATLEAAAPCMLAVGLGSLADYFEEMASLSSYRSGEDVTSTWLEAASHARSQAAHISARAT